MVANVLGPADALFEIDRKADPESTGDGLGFGHDSADEVARRWLGADLSEGVLLHDLGGGRYRLDLSVLQRHVTGALRLSVDGVEIGDVIPLHTH